MKKLNLNQMEALNGNGGFSCGLAIAGSIVAIAGFAFVTGGGRINCSISC